MLVELFKNFEQLGFIEEFRKRGKKLETSQIITLISGAGLGAILSAILVFVNNSKRNQLDYITKERSEWRKSLKLIIVDLLDGKNRKSAVSRLKSQINPYGFDMNVKYINEYYMKDGHIWDLLSDFDYSEEKSQKLSQYLELLLKYDWERSKNEVGFSQTFLWNLLRWGLIFLNTIMLFWTNTGNSLLNKIMSVSEDAKNIIFNKLITFWFNTENSILRLSITLFFITCLFSQNYLIKRLSKSNINSPKNVKILIVIFIMVFLFPYLYSLFLTIILLVLYNLFEINLIIGIFPIIIILITVSSELFFLYQIFNIDFKYISQINRIEKSKTSLELEYYKIYNNNYKLKQKILNMKYYITRKDVNILEKKYTKLRKKITKKQDKENTHV